MSRMSSSATVVAVGAIGATVGLAAGDGDCARANPPLAASSTRIAASPDGREREWFPMSHRCLLARVSKNRLSAGTYGSPVTSSRESTASLVEGSPEFGEAFLGVLLKPRPDLRVQRVEFNQFARLGVLHGQQADRGQCDFVRVLNPHRHQIMPPMGLPHRAPQDTECRVLISAGLEIGNQKRHGATRA